MALNPKHDVRYFNSVGQGCLPDYLSIEVLEIEQGVLRSQLQISPHHLAPNGYLHAATIIALADTSAGYACIAHLPETAENFTTLELKANFISTLREGTIECVANAVHLGRTTQIWEATVFNAGNNRKMATFSCTQLLLQKKTAQ